MDNTVVEVVRQGSLKWLDHVVRKKDDYFVEQARRFEVGGTRGRGRSKLAQKSMMKNLCHELGSGFEDASSSEIEREG